MFLLKVLVGIFKNFVFDKVLVPVFQIHIQVKRFLVSLVSLNEFQQVFCSILLVLYTEQRTHIFNHCVAVTPSLDEQRICQCSPAFSQ